MTIEGRDIVDNAGINRRLHAYQLHQFCRVCLHGVVRRRTVCSTIYPAGLTPTYQGITESVSVLCDTGMNMNWLLKSRLFSKSFPRYFLDF